MERLRKTYAITSVLFLAILAVSPLKDYLREWRAIQTEFNRYIEKLPQRVKPAPIALQQIWARELDRVDRCITCHLGVSNSRLRQAPQPFRTHPRIPHDFEKFGCTICHQGQGAATDFDDAHLASEFWDQPVLPNRYLESSCGRCHIGETLAATPTLNRGRKLIEELSCAGCHRLPRGYRKSFAPTLDGIGAKVVNRNWLVRWLKNPREIQPRTRMPNFLLSDEEAEILADFLMSFKTFPNGVQLEPLPPVYHQRKEDEDFIALGRTRFREARCVSCHTVNGRGGHLATDLGKVASKATAIWIYNYLKNPRRLQPEVEMPQYGFTDEEVAAITAYIESEFVEWEAPEETPEAHPPAPDFFARGIALFNYYNCGGCHTLSSEKVTLNMGPDLTGIGSKRLYQIDFGTASIPHTLHDYIKAKIASPRSFGAHTRMPVFPLNEADQEAITTALLSHRTDPLPMKFMRVTAPPEPFRPQGELGKIFRKYSCLKCHSIRHTGGNIAPDLSIVGSQLKREWVENYFKLPYTLRPIVTERMPNLFIDRHEIQVLTDFFYTMLIDDRLTLDAPLDTSEAAIERGRGLFWEKYGCQSCHILGGKGGYVGPPLDNVGDRLQPGWLYHYLLDPLRYKPDSVEPRTGMTREEARDLTAYLMSLKAEKTP
ncbi:MAG: cytochrome c [Calditrichaeota bacterium]|nr:MAG: cytochrome c [Calditrichota bacterium]